MKAIKNIFSTILCLIAALALFQCLFITFSNGDLFPTFLSTGAYVTNTGEFGDILPHGSIALTKKTDELERGDIIVYLYRDDVAFGAVIREDGDNIDILSSGEPITVHKNTVAGKVFYQITHLGYAASVIKSNRIIVWSACGVLIALAFLWIVTLPGRRRKGEIKELIKLFDHYGHKYDLEEADIDY
ncbi:MAG: hypothetical protein VB078_01530 [Clostridiaceae bacterium]|nr:hypothetical protein [Clostridiaceae bacterium]